MSRVFKMFVVAMVCSVGCQKAPVKETAQAPQIEAAQQPEVFKLKELPKEEEWEVKLPQPLIVAEQKIFNAEMPDCVYAAFPIEEYKDREPGAMFAMVIPEQQHSYGYRMTMDGGKQLVFKEQLVFTQPDVGVGDLGGRIFVTETRPLAKWLMISWQKSPYIEGGKPFVPVDWDLVEKTGLSIPGNRALNQRGYRNETGTTVCQMFGNTVGAYLNSADLSVNGLDENGNPLPGGDGYKQGFFPEYLFYPQKLSDKDKPIYLWRKENSRLEISLEMQIPIAECAEKNGSIAYANPLLLLVDPKTNLRISWGPMLFSKRSQGDYTKPLQNIALDIPSNSWMVRDRLVTGASYLELAPGSAQYQTAPWRGFKLFAWTVTRVHVEKALKVMHEQEPQLQMSLDPGDYYLSQFHLNAETNYQTAPTELGWSMRNLRIVLKYPQSAH